MLASARGGVPDAPRGLCEASLQLQHHTGCLQHDDHGRCKLVGVSKLLVWLSQLTAAAAAAASVRRLADL